MIFPEGRGGVTITIRFNPNCEHMGNSSLATMLIIVTILRSWYRYSYTDCSFSPTQTQVKHENIQLVFLICTVQKSRKEVVCIFMLTSVCFKCQLPVF